MFGFQQGTKKKRSASESGPSPIGPGGDAGGGAGVIRPIPVKVPPGMELYLSSISYSRRGHIIHFDD